MSENGQCAVDSCEKKVARREWCSPHYHRNQRHGDPLGGGPAFWSERPIAGIAPRSRKRCEIDGCEKVHKAQGYCGTHYRQFLRSDNPIASVLPPFAERFWERVVKHQDGCWEWGAVRDNHGYGTIRCDGKTIRAHRWAYEDATGPIPDGLVVDHLCHNRGCVNPDHLRTATPNENTRNRPLVIRGVTVGAGVHPMRGGRFGAVAEIRGFPVTLGSFAGMAAAQEAIAMAEGGQE